MSRLAPIFTVLLAISIQVVIAQCCLANEKPAPKAVVTREKLFSIPFYLNNRISAPKDIRLYVSGNRGKTWSLYQTRRADDKKFDFHAGRDGEYWFVVGSDRYANKPQDGTVPEKIVRVDTQNPAIDLTVTTIDPGKLSAKWKADDTHLDGRSFRLSYQTSPESDWIDIDVVKPDSDTNPEFDGEVSWMIAADITSLRVRAEVLDRAGNQASVIRSAERNEIGSPLASTETADSTSNKPLGRLVNSRLRSSHDLSSNHELADETHNEIPTEPRADSDSVSYSDAPEYPDTSSHSNPSSLPNERDPREEVPGERFSNRELARERRFSDGADSRLDFRREADESNHPYDRFRSRPAGQPPIESAQNRHPSNDAISQPYDYKATGQIAPSNLADDRFDEGLDDRSWEFQPRDTISDTIDSHSNSRENEALNDSGRTESFNSGESASAASSRATIESYTTPDASSSNASSLNASSLSTSTLSASTSNGLIGGQRDYLASNVGTGDDRNENEPRLPAPQGSLREAPQSISRPDSSFPDSPNVNAISIVDHYTNSKQFNLDYDVTNVSSGVARVELWATTDEGRTWEAFGVDEDQTSPFLVELNVEGRFGFQLLLHGLDGRSARPPQPGDSADMIIEVDTTRPVAFLTDAKYDLTAKLLEVDWKAQDKNLDDRPVTLSYAETLNGPWVIVARDIRNSGRYQWRPNAPLPRVIYVQIDVQDQAGNRTVHQFPKPLSTIAEPPRGRIRAVRPR